MAGDDVPRSGSRAHALPALGCALVLAIPLCAQDDGDLRTEAPPAYQLQPGLLRGAFLDLFGRPPFRDEREEWAGRGLQDLLDARLGDEEFWAHWLDEQLYYFLLIDNFRPESERVLSLPTDLTGGRLGVKDAIHRVLLSSSFDQRNPGADTFVTVVMEQLLRITVQQEGRRDLEIGKKLYDGHIGLFLGRRGSTQADVVQICVADKRMLRRFVEREYVRLIRAEPGTRDVNAWAKRLESRPGEYPALVREWMLSPAYLTRLSELRVQPNRMFVRALYVDLMDRDPDDQEARTMRDALDGLSDPGPLRSILAKLILDSGRARVPHKTSVDDPTQWVAGLFRDLLGREASAEELMSFVGAFHDPECRSEMVVYALVSHPEYHHY